MLSFRGILWAGVVLLVGLMLLTLWQFRLAWQQRPQLLAGFTVYPQPREVLTLYPKSDTEIWAGTKRGLFRVRRSDGAMLGEILPPWGRMEFVRAIADDPQRGTLVAFDGGLGICTPDGTWRDVATDAGFPSRLVTALAPCREQPGAWWVGTAQGLVLWNDGVQRVLGTAEGLTNPMTQVLMNDHLDGLWVGAMVVHHGGVTYRRGGHSVQFSIKNGMPHDSINALLQTRDRHVWVGCGYMDSGGLVEFALDAPGPDGRNDWPRLVRVLGTAQGMPGAKVRSIYQHQDGALWLGYEYDSAARWQGGKWQHFEPRHGLANTEVTWYLADPQERCLWLATLGGLTKINQMGLELVAKDDKVSE